MHFEVIDESYSLTVARTHLGELVSRARYSHRPLAITEHGKPSVAIINIDDLADLEDRPPWPTITPPGWRDAAASGWLTWMPPWIR